MRVSSCILAVALVACVDPSVTENTAADSYDGATASLEDGQTLRATVAEVSLLDARGTVIASLGAFEPAGSRDEVLGIRIVPQAYVGAPLIAVTTTVGGHRESTTYIALYRVQQRKVERLFVGAVEEVADESVASGSLLVFPGTILYRAPHAELATVLTFDSTTRRYVAQ